MRWAWQRTWALALIAIRMTVPAAAHAESTGSAAVSPQSFYGPLRTRDLSPFGFLRLDMRPTLAGSLTPGRWTVETELAYQNTWALSDHVQQYLQARGPRRSLTEADVAAIVALPGENYLVDLELLELDLMLHRQLTPTWGAYLIVSGVAYGGGALDGFIEQFHSAFGMSDYGRPALPRGQINVLFDLASLQAANLDAGQHSGLLDPTLGIRYSGVKLPAPWSLALEAAVKVPVGGTRDWLSTGRTDVGAQASLLRRGTRHAFFTSLSLVDYAGSKEETHPDADVIPTLVFGFDSHLTDRLHSVVQFYVSPSAFDSDTTGLDELNADKYLLSLGLRHHRGAHLVFFAVTENIVHFNNTPDIAFQLGYTYRPQ